ncbi:hypothetical protein OC846_004366 [Tilletia horrida]|uniref:Uncharacterized protein n=1 Tax=Tilletia horrida TaxID=155126 RepID=A0AAN6GMW0_9BASI|nr:hypothetical protein OC845_003685 [Tilletia horrida]KAK0548749.1 hypothetical protein OC846_004366 [Tilletia horrida]KAK0563854.1 hypothetical protein OC861_004594 [Tilletia horrida]
MFGTEARCRQAGPSIRPSGNAWVTPLLRSRAASLNILTGSSLFLQSTATPSTQLTLLGRPQRLGAPSFFHSSARAFQQETPGFSGKPGPPPTAEVGNGQALGSKTTSSSPPRGIALVRRHPILAVSSFILTHVGVCWLMVPPTYLFLHYVAPGGTTAMLAGPQTAWLLSYSVPKSMTGTVPGFRAWSQDHVTGDATFEDLLEYFARNASKVAWRGAKSTVNIVSTVRSGSARKEEQEEEEIADEAVKSLKGSNGNVTRKALDKLGFSKRAQEAASDIRFSQVKDAVAAYVFIKALFPLRLPLSFFLFPKVARAFMSLSKR